MHNASGAEAPGRDKETGRPQWRGKTEGAPWGAERRKAEKERRTVFSEELRKRGLKGVICAENECKRGKKLAFKALSRIKFAGFDKNA